MNKHDWGAILVPLIGAAAVLMWGIACAQGKCG